MPCPEHNIEKAERVCLPWPGPGGLSLELEPREESAALEAQRL